MKSKNAFLFYTLLMSLLLSCTSSAESTIPDFVNIPDANSYDVILVGEDHTNSENNNVELRLMKHYFAQGIRDFAFETGYADALFFQYYVNTGNKECLEFLFRINQNTLACTNETLKFYKDIYKWNSKLKEKIKIHGFDIEHKPVTGITAAWFFILKNYKQYKDIPLETSQDRRQFALDYNSGRERFLDLKADDKELLDRIMMCIRQAELVYSDNSFNDALREQCMTENFLEIMETSKNKKVFAMTGAWHAALTGLVMGKPGMANTLKNKMRVTSIFLGQYGNQELWPYSIWIDKELKTTPYLSTYTGNWPFK